MKENGHTPTLMDYSRFNYVAQPEDKIDRRGSVPEDRAVRQVGDDVGLQADPGAKSADDEKKTLDEWARRAGREAVLRFSTAGSRGADPGELTEAVGDEDAVAVDHARLKNLERVAAMLMPATTTKAG